MKNQVQTHRIGRAIFDLKYPNEATAFVARKRLNDLIPSVLVPALELALDGYSRDPRQYVIERLEVVLGTLGVVQLEADQLLEALLRSVAGSLERLPPAQIIRSQEVAVCQEILTVFLVSGRFPWLASISTVTELETAVFELSPAAAGKLAERLRPLLLQLSPARRFVYQFSPRFYAWILAQLHPAAASALLTPDTTDDSSFPFESYKLAERFDRRVALLRAAAGLTSGSPPEALSEQLNRFLATHPTKAATPLTQPSPQPPDSTHAAVESEDEEALRTGHAGIVLLHPFLVHFFKELDLIDQAERFLSREAHERSVHLLYYLGAGREHPEEHETLLHKALCGYPLDEPLRRQLTLEKPEKEEANRLLQAAISHWKKLKATSPDGLREGFLQREGRLTQSSQGWTLIVEPRSVDILLEYLPWTIATIRLPWMGSPLSVEWAT